MMQNKKYLEFAKQNTVEVLALQRLAEGVQKKDPRAVAYKAKGANGEERLLMLNRPNLTLEEIEDLSRSKAGSFNKTGKIPYTSIVDPWTETEIKGYNGGSAKGIQEDVAAALVGMRKEHGKGVARKDLAKVDEAIAKSQTAATAGDFAKAIEALTKVEAQMKGVAEVLTTKLTEARAAVVSAAESALAAIENSSDNAKAKKDLLSMLDRLRGTGLEAKAKEILQKL
ncbi:MAG: hypothetical protein EXS14_09495 [Planctomycetes bacterium]|nr:hypothetical protein [Planctomycetota bacterium]